MAEAQLVNDLLWVVNSPSLCSGANVAPHVSLDADQIDGDALSAFMAQRRQHRVGRYFEHLLLFWLSHVRSLEMIGNGMQIREGKRTIGEIDYLYRNESDQVVHCEATVKFFLHHPRPSTSDFPGPNATDNFERKMAKLFGQQLELSKAHFPDVTLRHAFVKGMTFHHPAVAAPTTLPDRMPVDHLTGQWLRASELELLGADQGHHAGVVHPKPLWLSALPAAQAMPLQELRSSLHDHFGGSNPHPVMVGILDVSGVECQRLFVVSDTWPERAASYGASTT